MDLFKISTGGLELSGQRQQDAWDLLGNAEG